MEEAELLCDRILIIDHGRILAEGTPQQLIANISSTMRVSVQTEPTFQGEWLDGITDFSMEAQGASFSIPHAGIKPTLAKLLAALEQHDAELLQLRIFKAALEDVICKLTGSKAS
jgi:ABC-2 type transport system ATP-binding protein